MAGRFTEEIGLLFKAIKKCKITIDEPCWKCYNCPQMGERKGSKMPEFVSYLRVSTKKQGANGLGMEAQKEAVSSFARSAGGKILREFIEVESGAKTERERPELAAALAYAKRSGAVLLVAKLDRLARNVAFLSRLVEAKVDFLACDMPYANKFTIHVIAAVAEWEREQISARTKAALARAKARGVALGSAREGHWKGKEEARKAGAIKGSKKGAKVMARKAREEYADLYPIIRGMRDAGLSYRKIAAALNAQGHKTRRGKDFLAPQVENILKRGQ